MRQTANEIATACVEYLRGKGADVLTMPWTEFYKFAGRERIKPAFMEELALELRAHSLLMCQGQAVVVVMKDFNFSPRKGA